MFSVFHVAGRCRIDEDRGAGEDQDREHGLARDEGVEA
jgi:hypothetical protein